MVTQLLVSIWWRQTYKLTRAGLLATKLSFFEWCGYRHSPLQAKEVSDEEDEVKVHATDDIEGGEAGDPSSGEEGEIKGTDNKREDCNTN